MVAYPSMLFPFEAHRDTGRLGFLLKISGIASNRVQGALELGIQ